MTHKNVKNPWSMRLFIHFTDPTISRKKYVKTVLRNVDHYNIFRRGDTFHVKNPWSMDEVIYSFY